MPHLETVASPAIVVMFLACILGLGFMVRFLLALTFESRTTRARHMGVHYAADMVGAQAPYRRTALGSAAHFAIGVLQITTALTYDAGRAKQQASLERLHLVTSGRRRREPDFTAEHRYRSG